MAYMGPKGSIPTHRGWVHPKTGELLKRQKLSSAFIAEWHGHSTPAPAPEPAPVMQTLHEAPMVEREVTEAEVEWHAEPESEETPWWKK